MVSGLFEPIGHKKWPLKFHFHDFEEFVLGKDGRAHQNELRVCDVLQIQNSVLKYYLCKNRAWQLNLANELT